MRTFRLVVPMMFAVALPITAGTAQDPAKLVKAEVAVAQPVKETWAVVSIGEHMKVMKTSEVATAKKKLEADHRAAMAKYHEAMKVAEASHAKFAQPAPAASNLVVVAADLKSADDASAQLKKLQAELDAKEAKGKEKTKEHPVRAKETVKKKGEGKKGS